MTVGIVIVSHSAKIAQGTVELAAQMAPSVALYAAGGTDDDGIGTSFDKVMTAIGEADSGDGVVIMCDLGSAVLTAETALEFIDDDQRARTLLADAAVVEGTVAGAVAAETGGDVAAVISAAEHAGRGGLSSPPSPDAASSGGPGGPVTRTVTLINRDGLHARPAADFVKRASGFDAHIRVNGVDAKSLLGIMSLGLVKGRDAELAADGPEARKAIEDLAELIESGFGEK